MKTIVIVPTYNESENIEILCARILAELPDAQVLFVDDNSPDGTGELADDLSKANRNHIAVLHRADKEGLGAAYVAGYLHALETFPDAEFFIQMDADLSHDPKYLPEMIEAAGDADLVVASRYVNGISIVNWPLNRLIVSKLGTAYARLVTGLPITDCTAGFKCYRRRVLEALRLDTIRSNGYVFQIETSFRAWRLGFKLKDVPIIFYERQRGQSKLDLSIALETFRVVLMLGLERLLHRPKTALVRTPESSPEESE